MISDEFRTFVARGNVFELAVGIVIGAAFKDVVDSFVRDLLMPPIGLLMGGVDFSNLYVSLSGARYETFAEAQAAGAATLNYGVFINQTLQFLIVAVAVFMLLRSYNRLREPSPAPPPTPTERECPFCRLSVPIAAVRCGHCTSEIAAA